MLNEPKSMQIEIDALKIKNQVMRESLQEISQGKGSYSCEPLQHAENTVRDMKQLALDALAVVGAA